MFKNVLRRSLTPTLTILMVMLGTVTGISLSKSQQKAEAFGCAGCSGPGTCSGIAQCRVCISSQCVVS